MKSSIKQNFFLVIKLTITYILLINSVKFFTYILDPYSFRFVSFVEENDTLENPIYRKIVYEYSKTLFNQEVIYFSFFLIFLIGSMFLLARTKQSIFSYFFITIFLYLIQRLDIIKFNHPNFFAIVPKNICEGLRYYLMINGLIFLLIGMIFFLVNFRIFRSYP